MSDKILKRKACEQCGKVMYDVNPYRRFCDKCARERALESRRVYREKNKEHIREWFRQWRKKNREQINAAERERRNKPRPKICERCGQPFEGTVRTTLCPDCRRKAQSEGARRAWEFSDRIAELEKRIAKLEAELNGKR